MRGRRRLQRRRRSSIVRLFLKGLELSEGLFLVTADTMRALRKTWGHEEPRRDGRMLWTACCFGWFVFLRAGEFKVPAVAPFDPALHHSLADVQVDNWRAREGRFGAAYAASSIQSGINASKYTGYSFRIGAATAAADAGIEDLTIQTLRCWRSDSYQRCLRRSSSSKALMKGEIQSVPHAALHW